MSTIAATNLKNPSSASNNIVLDSAGGAAFQQIKGGALTLATAQNSTSGTSIDFTGIPSWVKRITVMFNGVSTNGASFVQAQIGAGSITSSGYACAMQSLATGPTITAISSTTGFLVGGGAATVFFNGHLLLTLISGNTWIGSGVAARTEIVSNYVTAGSITLSGTLDRVRITTVNGADTFDAGSINLLYEG